MSIASSGFATGSEKIGFGINRQTGTGILSDESANTEQNLNKQRFTERASFNQHLGQLVSLLQRGTSVPNGTAGQGVKIIGLNYRDKAQSAVEFLHRAGNPFLLVVDDSQGKLAMQLGVDGAPETYLVDEHGVIRYRYSGAIDKTVWRRELLPELEKLRK